MIAMELSGDGQFNQKGGLDKVKLDYYGFRLKWNAIGYLSVSLYWGSFGYSWIFAPTWYCSGKIVNLV